MKLAVKTETTGSVSKHMWTQVDRIYQLQVVGTMLGFCLFHLKQLCEFYLIPKAFL
jgi:hypothetical protein